MGPVETLREMGFEVVQLSEYHFRVQNEIDFWLPRGRWHDLLLKDRGKKPLEQIPFFIKERLTRPKTEVGRKEFIDYLVALGWAEAEAEEAWTERQSNRES